MDLINACMIILDVMIKMMKQDIQKKEIREMLQNYPILNEHHSKGTFVYPCAFVIIDKTFECGKIYVDIIESFTFDEIAHMYMYL
jgi:hypothetical protein